ncbi:MAG: hypothetical protein H0U52_00890 [Chloroflexi bacterium]|nr:hypothetical protein [Chloroflexota bacterium]
MATRWHSNVIPPLLAAAALLVLSPAAGLPQPVEAVHRSFPTSAPAVAPVPRGTAVPLSDLSSCPEPLGAIFAATSPSADDPGSGPWYRLDPQIDRAGSLIGQILTVGASDHGIIVGLDREAAASGPVGDAILVVSDDGATSRLAVVDARVGCVRSVARTTDLIRRAVLDPSGTSIVEHRLERSSRTSAGIWRRPLGDQAASCHSRSRC